MNLEIKKEFIESYKEICDKYDVSYPYWREAEKFSINIGNPSLEMTEAFYNHAKIINDGSTVRQLSFVRNVLLDMDTTKIGRLRAFEVALSPFLKNKFIRGWIFRELKGFTDAYLITDIGYRDARINSEEKPYVYIKIAANAQKGSDTEGTTIRFYREDVVGHTMSSALSSKGFYVENAELIAEYDASCVKFQSERRCQGKQYVSGSIVTSVRGKDRWDYKTVKLSGKVVNDDVVVRRTFKETEYSSFWKSVEIGKESVYEFELPVHPYINCFHLEEHVSAMFHVSLLTPYVYNDDLRNKIVLPEAHRDLIETLVEDMDVFNDIIEGKSGGINILSYGPPGTGKTLTAEVYSEVSHKPLYKVHSGQLGTTPETIEETLKTILARADRIKAVLLIDEADVYIRRRGNDVNHNAIVACFLRTLEYFSGLLFMTTNRSQDVDEAIVSRCIAIIKYGVPSKEDARKIWRILSNQFGANLTEEDINQSVESFSEASGRDIKELLKLSVRYAHAKSSPAVTYDILRKCAQFKGTI